MAAVAGHIAAGTSAGRLAGTGQIARLKLGVEPAQSRAEAVAVEHTTIDTVGIVARVEQPHTMVGIAGHSWRSAGVAGTIAGIAAHIGAGIEQLESAVEHMMTDTVAGIEAGKMTAVVGMAGTAASAGVAGIAGKWTGIVAGTEAGIGQLASAAGHTKTHIDSRTGVDNWETEAAELRSRVG